MTKYILVKQKNIMVKKKQGIEGRLRRHISQALNNENDCPRLYNAIRKYGKDSFMIEELKRCSIDECDNYEIKFIEKYNSTNRDIGYNIALGGGGRSVVDISDETRNKMSIGRKNKTVNVEPNIGKLFRKNIHVGYGISIILKGIRYTKDFSSSDNYLEQNLELAREWLKLVKSNKLNEENNIKYNKKSKLPRNITYEFDKDGNPCGYNALVIENGKRYRRSFTLSENTLDEKLELAKKWLEDFKAGKINKDDYGSANGKNPDLPKNISVINRDGELVGYAAKITINKKKYHKQFTQINLSLEEKKQQAIDYKNEILNNGK